MQSQARSVHREWGGDQFDLRTANAPRPSLPEAVRNRRKTGFTLPINEWLKQEGRVEFGKRSWARKVCEVMFGAENGYW